VIDSASATADLLSMAENVSLELLGKQMERMLARQDSLSDDIRVLTTIVLRHDSLLNSILDQLHAMTAQHNRFNDRLRRLEDQPAE
jgi:hypothetical protein